MKKRKIFYVGIGVIILLIFAVLICYWYLYPPGTVHIRERYNFADAISVTVYDIDPKRYEIEPERLKGIFREDFDIHLFRDLIESSEYKKPIINKLLWMGGSLATVQFSNGEKINLAFSYVGACFIVIGENGYYTIKNRKDREKWKNEFMYRIVQYNFIPQRIIRNDKESVIDHMQEILNEITECDHAFQMMAISKIGYLGSDGKFAVPALIKVLSSNELDIRKRSVWALGEIGPQAKAAIPNLRRLLNDLEIKDEVKIAIDKILEESSDSVEHGPILEI